MTRRVQTALIGVALGIGLLFACSSVRAGSARDYNVGDEAWNGLDYLLVTAEEAHVSLTVPSELDLRRLGPGDVVFWIQPKRALPTEDLLSFVRDGGHLIVADDVGESGALMEALGITRDWGVPSRHERFYREADGIPVLTPSDEHFLFFNVESIAANYPANIRGAGEQVLQFDASERALVIERRWGGGTVLLISDASVFLNEMLRRFYGNKQFAANVMRLFCDQEDCSVILVLPETSYTGSYNATFGRLGAVPFLFDEAAERLNSLLETLNRVLNESYWLGYLLLCVLMGLVVWMRRLLLAGLRAVAPPPLAVVVPGLSPFESYVRGLESGKEDADFAFSAQIMINEVERLKTAPSLHTLMHDERGRGRANALPGEGRLASQTRQALLRIEEDADNLRGADARVFEVERLFRLLVDVKMVRRYLARRPHSMKGTVEEPPKPS